MSPIAAAIAMITRPNASATVNVVSGKVEENSRAAPQPKTTRIIVLSARSNKKRQKQYQSMLDGLKAGSRVRTIGGIYGTVTAVKGDVVFVSVGPDKVRLVFTKQAIASIEDSPVEATLDGEIVDSSEKR